jgi:hypothetical protein
MSRYRGRAAEFGANMAAGTTLLSGITSGARMYAGAYA